tara:strand:+ start:148 stop:585 length:438 start_codon:yes stop_codon:yes gene_type:complete
MKEDWKQFSYCCKCKTIPNQENVFTVLVPTITTEEGFGVDYENKREIKVCRICKRKCFRPWESAHKPGCFPFFLLLLVPLLLTPFYDAVFNSEEPTSKFSTFVGALFISFIWFFLWRSSGNKKEALCKEIYERWKTAEELKAEEK